MGIKKNAKVILDLHEYSPRQHDNLIMDLLFKKFRVYFFKRYLKQCDLILTVSDGIAQEYQKNFGVLPIIITNASPYKEIQPRLVDPDNIKMIHHGDTSPARKLEKMIEIMKYTEPRFSLYFMLIKTDLNYYNKLKKMAGNIHNVHFIDPVPMNRIVDTINQFDIGLFLLEPFSFNAVMALPNKFFEFVQARLALAIGPSPEMIKLVKKFDLGIISDDFSPKSMAKLLNNLSAEKIQYYKDQSHRSAYELSSKKNDEIIAEYISNFR
jgi:glycosyltransferase involved in cell wall biosynthesis